MTHDVVKITILQAVHMCLGIISADIGIVPSYPPNTFVRPLHLCLIGTGIHHPVMALALELVGSMTDG